ncbi:hypothetical protein [Bradyrhizobium sp. SEMIA]|uniref:hypothetical protein n=1 Tax=Bradyrhizobium sp. SEMIA TaxID=2597515 RepID=UPI0018A3A8B6|nr:hypothetical protein [Bradyrhizobium sp. SEMIA]QOG23418.1 hypothetical protein FOM02_45445 [Bradyrhizobium sp. SEMIA]
MLDEKLARIRAHRNNINRNRRLERTMLSDIERQFVERRLAEEQTALEALRSRTFSVTLSVPRGSTRPSNMGPAS